MADEQHASVGNILYPTGDVSAAVVFYKALGLPVKLQDGDRFAILDGGGVSVALAGGDEDVTSGQVAASLRVGDVDEAVRAATAAGATLVREPEEGPHEIRAVVTDPWGNPVVLYQKR